MKKHRFGRIIGRILIIVFMFLVGWAIAGKPYIDAMLDTKVDVDMLDELNLDKVNKLMIVAHPDDDTIWGGAHLLSDDYLVVCITNKDNKVRCQEFKTVMEASGEKCLILDYPDKVHGIRSNWNIFDYNIQKDIEKIVNYKDWEVIVTHNPDGEYGHRHHKKTSELVTNAVENKSKLWYFGKYYTKDEIDAMKRDGTINEVMKKTLDDDLLYRKVEQTKLYESQAHVMDNLQHMFPYENWVRYSEY